MMRINRRGLILFRFNSEIYNRFGLALLIGLFALTAARAQTAGSLDTTFSGDGKVSLDVDTMPNEAFAVAVQPDGKILIAGNNVNGSPDAVILARYTTTGSLDAAFGNAGVTTMQLDADDCVIRSIAVQPDGKILLAGNKAVGLPSSDILVMRFNANGTPDTSFDTDGWTTTHISHNDSSFSIVGQPDGKIIVAGTANREFNVYEGDFVLVRYNADGSLDATFDGDGKLRTTFNALAVAYSVALQPDGKIVAAGENQLTIPHSNADFAIARYNPDGSLDSTFGTGGKTTTDFNNLYASARSLTILPDGKIVVGGETIGSSSRLDFALVRYNASGSLDTTFGTNGKVTTNVAGDNRIGETRSLAVQSDGKIILVGTVDASGDNQDFAVVRYNTAGSLDSSFGAGGKVITDFGSSSDAAAAVTIQSDGKILVAGKARLTPMPGTNILSSDFALARYNAGTIAAQRRTSFDFDGDGRADVSVFRPSDRVWYLNRSTAGFSATQFGLSTDRITPGDFDGDAKTDIAVYRDGTWYVLQSSNAQVAISQFGLAGDIPQPGDYDGDGRADLAVFRPSNRTWYLMQSTGGFSATQFGLSDDKPVVGDYDGDGKTDIAVFRASDGVWYLLRSRDGFTSRQYGISTDKPVPADYDGDGKTDLAVYRDGVWYMLRSRDGDLTYQFGLANDVPVPADFDGDGKADIAVYRDGTWYLQRSTQGFGAIRFGITNDKPIPAAFVP